MVGQFSDPDEAGFWRRVLAWAPIPVAFLMAVALLTYDWRSVESLSSPPVPSSNWVGALGDAFAHYGYLLFGLAIWAVPALCVVASLCLVFGRRVRAWRRLLCSAAFLSSVACLVQAIGGVPAVSCAASAVNVADPGGAIGYIVMTRFLTPLVSGFGSAVLVVLAMAVSLIAAVGARNFTAFIRAVIRWAAGGRAPRPQDDSSAAAAAAEEEEERQRREAAERAKAEVRRQKEEDRERARAEKKAARDAKRSAAKRPDDSSSGDDGGGEDDPAGEEGREPYVLPPVSLLDPLKKSAADHGDVEEMSKRLIDTLRIFGVEAELAYTIQGPVVTKYAISLAPGIRYSAVTSISDNLMGALHARSLRIEAPIPGEDCVGIEVPNRAPAGISFREIVESPTWKNFRGELPLLFGKDAAGKELVADLASMPHMLVAGATGQGKSVCLNSIINGLLMTKTPEQLKLIMVDPKSVEFTWYVSLPHLIVPVITDNKKVVFALNWAVAEMEKRLKLFSRAKVKNIYDFNRRPKVVQPDMFGEETATKSDIPDSVPYIVIIIDEVADLMSVAAKEVVPNISRLTAKARAAGIHLILATQRPDSKVITGTIKANIPGRVAFKTATSIDSRTILDDTGAENLIGRGDMLFKSKDGALVRAQGAWISDPEIERIVGFIERHSKTEFDQRFAKKLDSIKEEEIDPFADAEEDAAEQKAVAAAERAQVKADAEADDFMKAVECVINTKRASTSHFQRQLGWGYNHAAKILDLLAKRGIVSEPQGIGPRQIVMSQDELVALFHGLVPGAQGPADAAGAGGGDSGETSAGGADGDFGGSDNDAEEDEAT